MHCERGGALAVNVFFSELALSSIGVSLGSQSQNVPRLLLFQEASTRLMLTFQIKFCMLNRRIRKMVRNDQKYKRSFVYVRMPKRVAVTGRFINYFTKFTSEFRYTDRLRKLLWDAVVEPERSVLVSIRTRQQAAVLARLLKI